MRVLAAVCLLLSGTVCFAADDNPEAAISTPEISARFYLPDANKGYYRGTRFDWSGVIYSLKYKGHEYYGPWYQKRSADVRDFIYQGPDIVAGPCSAITGPVEEYSTGGKALGFDEAQPGGTFIKIGIGVLRKPDARPYDHYRNYEVVDPGKWTVRNGPDWIEFTQELSGPNGYAYLYRKTVRLVKDKPQMTIEHNFRNTGRHSIDTDAYNHNFLVLDHRPPGPGYVVKAPYRIQSNRPPKADLAEIVGNELAYRKTLTGEETVSTPLDGFGTSPADYDFRVENSAAAAGMRVTGNKPLSRAMLWSIRSVVAVEPYIQFSLEPGKEYNWKFTYDFYTLPR